MSEKTYFESYKPNWIRPEIKKEMGEIKRVLQYFLGLEVTSESVDYLVKIIEKSEPVKLTTDIWQNLENTDSWHNIEYGEVEEVYKKIEKSNQKLEPRYRRNAYTIVKGMKSGNMEMPIIIKKEGVYHLVSGNTRLMVCRALKITPQVVICSI